MKRTQMKPIVIGALLLAVAGCTVGPNYQRPAVPEATAWKEQTVTTNTPILPGKWWEIFNDETLAGLETQAVRENQDLKLAMARVTEARALARASKADLLPEIGANGAYTRSRL